MSSVFEKVSTALIVASAVAIAAAAVRREFRPAGPQTFGVPDGPPIYVEGWESFSRFGTWMGDSSARVRIVAFSDYECPFCRQFDDRFAEVRDSVGPDVAMLVLPFPLDGHRFARPSALAAECAERQGRWESFHRVLFAKADSFGLKSWASYATDAGIQDTISFSTCLRSNRASARIDSTLALGERLKLTGTPTVLIDGMRYPQAPYDSLLSVVRRQLSHAQ